MTGKATRLTPEDIAELRERAGKEAGPFTDPKIVHNFSVHNTEWAEEILGYPYQGAHRVTWPELYLLHIAARREPNPPDPPKLTAIRMENLRELEADRNRLAEKFRRDSEEWMELQAKLPVKSEVRHNYTSARHQEFYTQGADHIYLLEDLHIGRLHRQAGRVLCWTPSRAKDLSEFPETAGDNRLPTCKACLESARKIAGA